MIEPPYFHNVIPTDPIFYVIIIIIHYNEKSWYNALVVAINHNHFPAEGEANCFQDGHLQVLCVTVPDGSGTPKASRDLTSDYKMSIIIENTV